MSGGCYYSFVSVNAAEGDGSPYYSSFHDACDKETKLQSTMIPQQGPTSLSSLRASSFFLLGSSLTVVLSIWNIQQQHHTNTNDTTTTALVVQCTTVVAAFSYVLSALLSWLPQKTSAVVWTFGMGSLLNLLLTMVSDEDTLHKICGWMNEPLITLIAAHLYWISACIIWIQRCNQKDVTADRHDAYGWGSHNICSLRGIFQLLGDGMFFIGALVTLSLSYLHWWEEKTHRVSQINSQFTMHANLAAAMLWCMDAIFYTTANALATLVEQQELMSTIDQTIDDSTSTDTDWSSGSRGGRSTTTTSPDQPSLTNHKRVFTGVEWEFQPFSQSLPNNNEDTPLLQLSSSFSSYTSNSEDSSEEEGGGVVEIC